MLFFTKFLLLLCDVLRFCALKICQIKFFSMKFSHRLCKFVCRFFIIILSKFTYYILYTEFSRLRKKLESQSQSFEHLLPTVSNCFGYAGCWNIFQRLKHATIPHYPVNIPLNNLR